MTRYNRWMGVWPLGGLLAALVGGGLLPAFGASPAPAISGYAATNPRGVPITSAPPGAPMLIQGVNLGTSGTVTFNGVPALAPASWSPTEILVTVPAAPSYPFTAPVTVTANGHTARGPDFTITPPTSAPPPSPRPPALTQSPASTPLPAPASPPTLGPGSLDPSFGSAGLVLTDFGGNDNTAHAVTLQPDGKIVVAGESDAGSGQSYFALARYNADGSLDRSFGAGGGGLTSLAGNAGANALALQPDGKIVVAGWAGPVNGKSYFALARYNSDGSPDSSFGAAGTVLTDFGGAGASANALALQPDGRIVAAGESDAANNESCFAVARYDTDGSLDPSFGSGGRVMTDAGTGARAVALQPDGRIVVAGDFGLVRYDANGSLDASFGTGGKVITDGGGSAVVVQPDGRIMVAGGGSVARYNRIGSLDSSFGVGGEVQISFDGGLSSAADALTLQPDGEIVVGGSSVVRCYPSPFAPVRTYGFALARYDATGALDPSFGAGGQVLTDFGGDKAGVQALAVQPDGQIIAVGWSDYDFALARYRGR